MDSFEIHKYNHIDINNLQVSEFNIKYDNPGDHENSWESRKNEVVGLIGYYHPDFLLCR